MIMYFTYIREDFFDKLSGPILLMCALDIDAICACKILQYILEVNKKQYILVPVSSIETLSKSFQEYSPCIGLVITINFGNLFDLVKLLKPSENLKFFVIDSHRPINVYNIYRNKQIRIFLNKHDRDSKKIPLKDEIFLKDFDGDVELSVDEEEEREQALLEHSETRPELRNWIVHKRKLLSDYEEIQYYSRPVSIIIYELATKLSQSNNYVLWFSIIGLTYQLECDKICEESFKEEANKIASHILRNRIYQAKGNCWTISLQDELKMNLYRQWNIHDSMWHTPSIVCKFKLWSEKGKKDFYNFFAKCGLPLIQVQNQYADMNIDPRKEILDSLLHQRDAQANSFSEGLITRAFILECGLTTTLSAIDVALAARATLESFDPQATIDDNFVRTIQILSCENQDFSSLDGPFEEAKQQMISMLEHVKAVISENKISDEVSFYHIDLQAFGQTPKGFARGSSLVSFASLLLEAYVSTKPARLHERASRLPMILFSPDYHNPEEVIIVGVEPCDQTTRKNLFPRVFERAASAIHCNLISDFSETRLVRCDEKIKTQFLRSMKTLLN